MSAAELSLIRAWMEGGKRNKALRGALYSSRIPIGFVRDGETLRKDPDARIQAAIATVFARFRQAGSARQATMLLHEAGEDIPRRQQPGALVEWGPARYEQVNRILTNPAMGGAYAYGFKRGVGHGAPLRPVLERWDILIPEKHEGYVSWPEWLAADAERGYGAARTLPPYMWTSVWEHVLMDPRIENLRSTTFFGHRLTRRQIADI